MKVLVTDPIHEEGIERLRRFAEVEVAVDLDHEALIEKIPEFDVLIVRSGTEVDEEVLRAAENLNLIVRAGVGLDNVDLEAAQERNIEIINTPEASKVAVAELTIGLMLAWIRKIPQADKNVRDGKWKEPDLVGRELWGRTLGIIGTGRVGRAVGRRARAFGMDLLGYDIERHSDFEKMGGKYVDLKTLLRESDYVTIHVQLNPSTKHLIGERQLKLMKPSVVLINTARGEVVDESALAKALKRGEIAGACLDVYDREPLPKDSPLLQLPNLILTPHIGASSKEAQKAIGVLAARKIERKFEVGELG